MYGMALVGRWPHLGWVKKALFLFVWSDYIWRQKISEILPSIHFVTMVVCKDVLQGDQHLVLQIHPILPPLGFCLFYFSTIDCLPYREWTCTACSDITISCCNKWNAYFFFFFSKYKWVNLDLVCVILLLMKINAFLILRERYWGPFIVKNILIYYL